MCGIAGVVDWQSAGVDVVRAMTRALAHRGPNAEGVVDRRPAALGARRLAIIDLDESANQPMGDASGRYWITFNGEIYNFKELRADLEARGVRFRTKGDTEALLHAYITWGPDCLSRLNGMFAFAVWDALEQRLFLARDRLGEKPLYYARLPGDGIAFASELKALRLHPAVGRTLSPRALSQYLSFNYILSDACILEGVKKLAAGHHLTVERGRFGEPRSYWDLAQHYRNKRAFASQEQAVEELNALIVDAVRLRLVSDVPLGAFLSGGIDSSTIVAAMSRLRTPADNITFSIGFNEKSYNEVEKAKSVASALSVRHHDRTVDGSSADVLQRIVFSADEPFADSSIIPTYFVSQFAAQHVTVCLTGDGGDELFGGYETYIADKLHRVGQHLPRAAISAVAAIADRVLPVSLDKVSLDYKARMFLSGLGMDADRAHLHWRTIFPAGEKAALVRPQHHASVLAADPAESAMGYAREVAGCHVLDRAMYVDIKTWLVDDILHKVDRASMAHSLEARPPFLDHRLVEFAAQLPVAWKVRGLRKKHLLKRSQEAYLPATTINERKQGFNAPVSHWIRGPLRELARQATLEGPVLDWLDLAKIESLWRDHDEGRRDNGLKLFGIACLGLWLSDAGAAPR
jgi:asparagine synthase (glutamine-hydrolysing)